MERISEKPNTIGARMRKMIKKTHSYIYTRQIKRNMSVKCSKCGGSIEWLEYYYKAGGSSICVYCFVEAIKK